jgi:uncharacterized oligopeptide transporter (OPT) family protein
MHTEGREAMDKARALFWAAGVGALLAFWRDGWGPLCDSIARQTGVLGYASGFWGRCKKAGSWAFPEKFPLFPGEYGNFLANDLTIGFEGSLVMIAAGAIMGIRVGISLLIGAVVFFGVIGPILIERGVAKPGYGELVAWTLWPATAMMVTSGLLSFAFRWRTVLRAFSGLTAIFSRRGDRNADPLAHIEVPGSWFVAGTLVAGTACVLLGHFLFEITWWMGVLAVLLTFILSIVAARATGETDVTPIGALGKITQLTYGFIAPSNMTTNLMTASITAGAAAHSADLLTDLKSGYMLGGNPRKQTISQLFGVLAGTLVCVPVYLVIANPKQLGSEELPAPAAKVWASVAIMIAQTFGEQEQPQPSEKPEEGKSPAEKKVVDLPKKQLHRSAIVAMGVGGLIGVLLTVAEEFTPPHYRQWLPSVTGLGIAGVVPAFNSISMFVGALLAWILSRASPKTNEKYTIAVSSGLIAGESLMGVCVRLCQAGPSLIRQMFTAAKPPN